MAGERAADGDRSVGVVRAYDAASGEVRWTHGIEGHAPGGLAVVGERVFVTVGPSLYELA